MHRTETHSYKVTPDGEIHIDLHWNPGQGGQSVLLWLHGGMLMIGSRQVVHPQQLELYVKAGYVVAAADYRLAPEAKLASIIEDIQDAYRWLRETGPELVPLDPEWIGVVGHSAGGYLTLMAGLCLEPRPRALVSFYGYGDIIGDWYSQPDSYYNTYAPVSEAEARGNIGHAVLTGTDFDSDLAGQRWNFYLYCRQNGLWPLEVSGHDPQDESDWFRPYCPAYNATPEFPPTMLIHGEDDTDVPVEQSIQMAEALAQQGVEHVLQILPGQPHGFDGKGLGDTVVVDTFSRILGFLDRHLRQ